METWHPDITFAIGRSMQDERLAQLEARGGSAAGSGHGLRARLATVLLALATRLAPRDTPVVAATR